MKKAITIMLLVSFVGALAPIASARPTRRPAHDDVAAASAVTALPFSERVDLRGATLEPDERQPSCRAIRSSVWYALTASEDATVVLDLTSTSPTAASVLVQSAEGDVEIACVSSRDAAPAEFGVVTGSSYLVQVGSAAKRPGTVDLHVDLSKWKEVTLLEQTIQRKTDEQDVPLLTLRGAPRQANPSMYDFTIQAWQQPEKRIGVMTYGLVKEHFEVKLVKLPASANALYVRISGRYDSSQYACAADDGGEDCYAMTPFQDPLWLGGSEGGRAELVLSVRAERDGRVVFERAQSIPYGGQVLGLLP